MRAVSKRADACRNCGDPFYVCPTSIPPTDTTSGHRLLRCCRDCTHWGRADIAWQETLATTQRNKLR